MAAKLNLTIEQHSTFYKRLVWRDKNKRPINLTGYSAVLHIRDTVNAATTLLEMTTVNGRIVITPLTGIVELKLTDEETGALTFKNAVYDLVVESAAGEKYRLTEGKVVVSPGVTHTP